MKNQPRTSSFILWTSWVISLFTLTSCLECRKCECSETELAKAEELAEWRRLDSLLKLGGQENGLLHSILTGTSDTGDLKQLQESLQNELTEFRRLLANLKEPDYGLVQEGDRVLRFIYSHDLGGKMASVSFLCHQDSCLMKVKKARAVITARNPYVYYFAIDSATHRVSRFDLYPLHGKLEDCNFEEISTNWDSTSGFDGSIWILEYGRWDLPWSEYQRTETWSPGDISYRRACLHFVEMADSLVGLNLKDVVAP